MHASLRVSARALKLLAAGQHLGLPWGAAGAMTEPRERVSSQSSRECLSKRALNHLKRAFTDATLSSEVTSRTVVLKPARFTKICPSHLLGAPSVTCPAGCPCCIFHHKTVCRIEGPSSLINGRTCLNGPIAGGALGQDVASCSLSPSSPAATGGS